MLILEKHNNNSIGLRLLCPVSGWRGCVVFLSLQLIFQFVPGKKNNIT
jgi:hypothetical protein